MIYAYLGPGVGISSIVILLGMLVTALFVIYAFVHLPLASLLRRRNQNQELD